MPVTHPRIMTVVDEELAQWLRRRSEERFWAKQEQKDYEEGIDIRSF